ncbi:MAG: LysE family translocator [Rhodobacteraceae bacterium]|nr:LysE family translocator [Paracoccaceae bacterium]
MFDYSILHWTTFLTATLLLNLSPGPDIAYILGQTVRGGRRAGFAALFGVWTGLFGHVLLAAAGLSAIIATSAVAFSIVKWVGATYLIWLGISALRSGGGSFVSKCKPEGARVFAVFRQGVLINLLNPKVAIFFLAFLPQFIVEGTGPIWAQLFLHGCLIILVAALIEPLLVLLGDSLTKGLRDNPRLGLWLDRSLGALFVALGMRLALQER